MTRFERLPEVAARTPVLAGSAVVAMVLLTVVFPALPIGGDLLDARFGYTFEEAMAAIAAYGEQGRRTYVWATLTLDTLLPAAYVGLLAGLVYRLRAKDRLRRMGLLPVAAGVLDLCENAQIAAMLIGYPDVLRAQVSVASLFTQLKTVGLSVCLALVVLLAALAVVNRIRVGSGEP